MGYNPGMRTLGIDPGTATTGFGIVDETNKKLSLVEYGVIKTSPKLLMPQRLEMISQGVLPSMPTLFKIAEVLNCKPKDLLS